MVPTENSASFNGVTLERLIGYKKLELSEFLLLAIQIAEALQELHHSNIIHYRINPVNILKNPENNNVRFTNLHSDEAGASEDQKVSAVGLFEKVFWYISPEQTGRTQYQVDYRTDFYSLGVTLYQVLTGRLPFEAQDELGLIHCHLAVKPLPPHEVNPDIPLIVSNIIMKLMEKATEDRYRSASGLINDLTNCLDQLQKKGVIEPFKLGAEDISDKFQISRKLYGREEQLELLLSAFERINKGARELLMVTGYTGVGKSSLIYQIRKPIIQDNGYFISGKYGQFHHNAPYSALIQAFKELVREILTQSETEIGAWKWKLTSALGKNGRVVSDIIPEIRLIIGEQPELIELPPEEAKNRFNMVFQKFVRVCCAAEHPLVIFLDDLQWADLPSLKLLEVLMADADLKHMLLIGAYRDNEVNEIHPLIHTLNTLQNENTPVNIIRLKPLSLVHIRQLLAEFFKHKLETVDELAEVCIEKTGGNPFFLNQFLYELYCKDLIRFNYDLRGWQWDLPGIKNAGITDNVVDLIADRLRKLAPETQETLKIAACIGNNFDLKTLSIIREKTA
jgi:hypothetical protein